MFRNLTLAALPLLSFTFVAAACSTTAPDELAGEAESQEAADGKSDSVNGASTYFAIRADFRRCIYPLCGGSAINEGNLIQRHFQDIHVITQHMQGRLAYYEMVGRHQMGLPIDEGRL